MKHIHVAVLLFFGLLAASCGGGKTATSTGTSGGQSGVQFTVPATNPTIDAGQSVTITANQPVMWSLQALGKPVGALSNTTTASATVTYTAPYSVTAITQVSVVATSAADSTQSAALGVVINMLPQISGTLSGNTSCQYDKINNIGQSNGTVGTQISATGASAKAEVLGGTGPFTWSVSSGSLPVGLTLQWGATAQFASNAYLFGTPVSSGCAQFAIQVVDATGAAATSPTYYVVIVPPALKIQVPNYTDAYSGVPYPPTALSVSGGTPPYLNWSVSNPSNALPPGMSLTSAAQNSAAAYVSGTPTGGGSVAGNNGSPYQPTLQVVDSQQPYPAYGSVQLSVYEWAALPSSPCTPADNANGGNNTTTNLSGMSGPYAFVLRGFDANGPVVIAGSFTTDGAGNISGGVEDAMRITGSQTGATITGGSYSLLQQSNSPSGSSTFAQSGCVMLTTSAGTDTFAISLGGCSTSANTTTGACAPDAQNAPGIFTTGRMIEFDDNTGSGTHVSGIVRLQTSAAFSAGLSGPYSFGLSGWDSAGSRYAAAGSLSASSGTLSSIAADINDGGALQSALTSGSGTYGAGSNGRSTGTFSVGTASLNLAFYVVSAQEVLLASTGVPSISNPILSGEAISAAGPFSASSLQNSHIFHTAGLASTGPDASIGILSFDGVSTFSGTQYEDQAGTLGTTSLSGVYEVDATTGRVVFRAPSLGQNVGDHPLVGYVIPVPATLTRQSCVQLAACVTGFLLSTDATAQAGTLEFQTPTIAPPPPFSNLYVAGYYFYGTDESLDASTPVLAGATAANPNGSHYAAIQSVSYPDSRYCQQPGCAFLIPNQTLAASGTYSVNSNGTGTIGGETVSVTNGNVVYYIDESPLNSHPSVIVIEQ